MHFIVMTFLPAFYKSSPVSPGDLIKFLCSLDIILVDDQRLFSTVHLADTAELAVITAAKCLGNIISPLFFCGMFYFRWSHFILLCLMFSQLFFITASFSWHDLLASSFS